MKKLVIVILIGLMALPVLCAGLYIGEWIHSEITYRQWLEVDPYRVDFTYASSKEEIRDLILAKIPPGTPEADVKAFFLANREQSFFPNRDWEPSGMFSDVGSGEVFHFPATSHGHLLSRLLAGKIAAFFILDPNDRSLHHIEVKLGGLDW
jgi:hypothetical protein